MPQLNWFSMQCVTEFYRNQAEIASKNREYRLAIHLFENAINEFRKHLEFDLAKEGIDACEALIATNEKLLEVQEANGGVEPEVVEEETLLTKGLDSLDDDSEEYRKKQLYE